MRGIATHDLVDHDEHASLRVLHRLHVAVDGAAQTRVHARLEVAVEARRLNVRLLGHEDEDVSLCGLGNEVQLVEHQTLDVLRGPIDDQV